MADVKIIDIDGIQWNIKDQESRNRITELENVLQTKANEIKVEEIGAKFIDFPKGINYFSVQVTVPDGYKCLFVAAQWNHPSELSITLTASFNFKGQKDIYGVYNAFLNPIKERIAIIGLLIKEN